MKGYIAGERMIKEQLTPQVVSRMFELDFAERENGVVLSRGDCQFLEIVEEGIRHRDDMRYEIPLPFRESNAQLPNNRSQADSKVTSSIMPSTSASCLKSQRRDTPERSVLKSYPLKKERYGTYLTTGYITLKNRTASA